MKASTLIEKLQGLKNTYGDLPLTVTAKPLDQPAIESGEIDVSLVTNSSKAVVGFYINSGIYDD